MSAAFSVSNSLLNICSNSSSCHTGVASDVVVKVEGEDPATPGPLKRNDSGTVTIPQYRVINTKQHTQRVHTTFFIRCDKPELTHWCLCSLSLHAGIQMSPDEVVGSRDGCRQSIAESTVVARIRLFRQIFSARTALFSRPFA